VGFLRGKVGFALPKRFRNASGLLPERFRFLLPQRVVGVLAAFVVDLFEPQRRRGAERTEEGGMGDWTFIYLVSLNFG
jgi:hypothetical protein